MTSISPGPAGTPVAADLWVLRVGKIMVNDLARESETAPPFLFELSTDDKAAETPRLSVYAEVLTTADQAWAILGSKPDYTVVACGKVEHINQVEQLNPATKAVERLRVEWDPSTEVAPGSEGHCGIANMYHSSKKLRRDLRASLAMQFRLSPVPVPHCFTEDEIWEAIRTVQSAALPPTDPDRHRAEAIRSLRRERSAAIRHSR